jgi:predicted tellurium resistance membrane protein TerC
MFELPLDIHSWATFVLLIGLELVLGIDNILLISILTSRLPKEQRELARRWGLGLALLARLVLLFGVSYLQSLRTAVFFSLTARDLVLLAGGLFLLYKATKEIHQVVECHAEKETGKALYAGLRAAVVQILLLDIVFSIDSIITGVGLTNNLLIIYSAVIVSFVLVLYFAGAVAKFVQDHPALKILALAFLVCIGVTLCLEAFHHEIPKAYVYLPMGFSLVVELLQMRHDFNKKKAKK